MKIGVFSVALGNQSLEEALKFFKEQGVNAVELGVGGYPGNAHCDPDIYLNNPDKINELKALTEKYGCIISALSAHANPIHPDEKIAKDFDDTLTKAILLAEQLNVPVVNTFSGCPGDNKEGKYPNWVTCPWPDDFLKVLEYQWNDVLIPYWKNKVNFAQSHNVKIALEMHPGFCVYNTETMLKLRAAVGEGIGANFDPSHLIWQGMDPILCAKKLGEAGAIFHVHAKDAKIDKYNTALNGVLDTKHYGDEINRSWIFRSLGYGNDYTFWRDLMSVLRLVGYDYVVSIEHEDSLMSQSEGLKKAISCLKDVALSEPKGEMWWA